MTTISLDCSETDHKSIDILLTRDAFDDSNSSASLIKISDFGLSRFIDPSAPLLTTRCGSESYAAPELVTGRPYDGRETDAWACGVVLYALVTRRLPFDAMNPANGLKSDEGHGESSRRPKGPRRDERAERRSLLMRIANGQYSWPDLPERTSPRNGDSELKGTELARSAGVRRVVGRLLVRDPRKRAKLAQLWEDEWMNGEGAPSAPVLPEYPGSADQASKSPMEASVSQAWDVVDDSWDDDLEGDGEEFDDLEEYEEDGQDEDGVLVDEHNIAGSVACQELMPP